MSNSDPNNPKPLPDDFGMTIPNMRLPKQDQSSGANLPTTNLRNAPQPVNQKPYNIPAQSPPPAAAPPDDFGMTIPNMRPGGQTPTAPTAPVQPPPPMQINDFDSTAPNIKLSQQQPSEPDFGMTLNNFQTKNSTEPDYGATMSYIPIPANNRSGAREEVREQFQQQNLPAAQPIPVVKRRGGVPVWAWALSGGMFLIAVLAIGLLALYFFSRESGVTLVLRGAPPGSTVLVDGTLRGVTSGDGSFNIPGMEAEKKRAIKVSKENCTDYNDTIIGENGETKELIVQMKCGVTPSPSPVSPVSDCADDPRVCTQEKLALDALDKLVPPFTVDQWAAAMNLQIINFESNSADVPFARKTVLEKGAAKFKLLTGNPGIEVGGHTDNVGNDASNQKLSESRAQAVRFILVNNGVNPKAFAPRGYGSKKPKVANDTEENKFQNRRIQYTVTSK